MSQTMIDGHGATLFRGGVAVQRDGSVADAQAAEAAQPAGAGEIWISGRYMIGATRDSEGEITPPDPAAAPRFTDALDASDFVSALRQALLARGFEPSAPLRAWLITDISGRDDTALAAALGVDVAAVAALKITVIDLIDTAREYQREDPRLVQFGALYGLTASDVEALFTAPA